MRCPDCPVVTRCVLHCSRAERPPHREDGPWAWLVLSVVFTHTALIVGLMRSFGVLLPVLMVEFDETRERTALIGSLTSGLSLLLSAPTSWLCGRFGGRLICAIGHVLCITGYVLSSLMYDIITLYFSYSLLIALGSSFIYIPTVIFTVKYFKKRRSLALGIAASGGGVGIMVMPLLAQFLITSVGWRHSFRIFACFYVLVCFLVLAYDSNIEEDQDAGDLRDGRERDKAANMKSMLDMSVWKIPQFTVSVISIAVASFGVYNVTVHLVKFTEEIGISADKASTLYTFIGFTSVLSRIIVGRLCDIPRVKASYFNQASEVIGAIAILLLTQAKTYTHLIIFSLFHGVVEGTFRTTINILFLSSVSQSKSSAAFGQGYSITSLFHATGPAIAGLLADKSGSYFSAFCMSGGVLLAAAAVHFVPLCLRMKSHSEESLQRDPTKICTTTNNNPTGAEEETSVVGSHDNPTVNTVEEITTLCYGRSFFIKK